MHRAIMHLQTDTRIVDFCGDSIKPGYWISVNSDPKDNYIKFDFKLKGSSGDLGASVIADYLEHRELNILEEEMKNHVKAPAGVKKVALAQSPGVMPQTNALLQKRGLSMFAREERESLVAGNEKRDNHPRL